ncbi:MAG: glucosamine-6-phosphate deaminase [Halioglobus sp.]|nr:glucosamine-6-phosphate deaminase [Halioglobus sp.]
MEILILPDTDAVAARAAGIVGDMVARRPRAVLGLATGGTPVAMYAALVQRHRKEDMSFAGVTSFNLDEYLGLPQDSPLRYRRYMGEHLFQHIDIDPANTHLPECAPGADPRTVGPAYEQAIEAAGGIDLQVLGIGANGHIGFNEPGSSLGSRTRVKTLAQRTVDDNSRLLGEGDEQPELAITMGIATIMAARRILLLATGEHKARAIALALEGPITAMHPASILQTHPRVRVILDEPAAQELAQLNYYRWVEKQNESIAARHGGSADVDPWFHPSVDP